MTNQYHNLGWLLITLSSYEFYFRGLCSVSELLAAKQSNDPAITIVNNIIPAILITFYQKNLVCKKY